MKYITLYFQVHQPVRLKTYRFFEIGSDHYYYDDYQNRKIIQRIAKECYLPANKILLDLIKEYGSVFKVAFSITGTAIEQFMKYAPEVITSFQELAKTKSVEFLGETYAHSLVSLNNSYEFKRQVKQHHDLMKSLFNYTPTTFRNTELIYSNKIADQVLEMGFNAMLTEGAKQTLGWKSPNFLYCNSNNQKLKLLLRNFQLSDDISFRFSQQDWSEWPLTAEKFLGWLNNIEPKQELVNIFLDYETFGEHQKKETGIFEFFKEVPRQIIKSGKFAFKNPYEIVQELNPIASIDVDYPISWADEERDLTAWLGNDMQNDAFENLYKVSDIMAKCTDDELIRDWNYLQASDNFYYMCTKWFSDGSVHNYFNPFSSPYEATINYMNVLSDFLIRVKEYDENNSKSKKTSIKIAMPIVKAEDFELKTKKIKTVKTTKTAQTKTVKKEEKTTPVAKAVKKTTAKKTSTSTKPKKAVEKVTTKKETTPKTTKKAKK